MSAYCVTKSGLCTPMNCCMHGKKPGERRYKCLACNDTGDIKSFFGGGPIATRCPCRDEAPVEPVTVKLADVIDTIMNVRSTIPADQAHGAAIMQGDIIRQLRERFVK